MSFWTLRVVGEDIELLPGGVRSVTVCRDGVVGEAAFEFCVDLFLHAMAIHEVIERPQLKRFVGRNGRVRPIAIIWIEQL